MEKNKFFRKKGPKNPVQTLRLIFKIIFISLALYVLFDFPIYYRGNTWNPEVILLLQNVKTFLEIYRLLAVIRGGLTLYLVNPYKNIFLTTLWNITDPIIKFGLFFLPKIFGIQFNTSINFFILSCVIRALEGVTNPPKSLDSLYEQKSHWSENWNATLRQMIFGKKDIENMQKSFDKFTNNFKGFNIFLKDPNISDESLLPQWPEHIVPWKSISYSYDGSPTLENLINKMYKLELLLNQNIDNSIDINLLLANWEKLHHINI